jgi:hypothetical protein
MGKPVKETASFKIANGDTSVSFKVEGSTVFALVEAFSWLTPARRLNVLESLQVKQAELLERERARNAMPHRSSGEAPQP